MFPILADLSVILDIQKDKRQYPSPELGPDWSWDWGWRIHPITHDKKWHNGIDLPAPSGTPIFAPWPGTVSKVAYDETSGHYLKLSHDPRHAEGIKETAYVHLNKKPDVKKGQVVTAGMKIAEVGSTGASTGPHLHFITRGATKTYAGGINRRDTDPLPFLERSLGKGLTGGMITAAGLGLAGLIYWLLSRR